MGIGRTLTYGMSYGRLMLGLGIPLKSDGLFWLDGTIIDVAGTKYFKDKTANARNFLITGYDFESTWDKGFPYKSSATISAPAGDVTLIAADIDNYLYDSGGTPNAIPVTCLFQNIDYKNKLFTRHASQVVNGNGIETYAPRILDVVLYNTVKTGTDLTKCQAYYGVPAIDANGKWIDPNNGNDTTGNGSQATPYKTHGKVNGLTLTEGTQVYCLTGTIDPFAWSKNYNLKAVGRVKIQNISSGRGIDYDPAGTQSQVLSGYWIDMANRAASVPINFNPINHPLTIDRFYITNSVSTGLNSGTSADQLVTLSNIVEVTSQYNIYCNKNTTVNGGKFTSTDNFLFKDNATLRTINLNNFKTTNPTFIRLTGANNLNITGGDITSSLQLLQLTSNTGNWSLKGSKLLLTKTDSSVFFNLEDHRLTNVDIDGCEFTSKSDKFISLKNQANISFKRNITHVADNNACAKLVIETTAAGLQSAFEIEGNTFNTVSQNGAINIGTEPTFTYKNKDSGVIQKNRMRITYPNSHGCMITNSNNVITKFNRIFGGSTLPIGYKSTSPDDYVNSLVMANICHDGGILAKGIVNLKIYNNTVIIENYDVDGFGCIGTTQSDTELPVGNIVKNNIFIYLDSTPFPMVRNDAAGNFYDYNIYYCPNTPMRFKYLNADKTFAEWQALGYDTHSIVLTDEQFNSLFNDFDNGDFTLKSGSSAIGSGVDLGSSFNVGLDSSTYWGSDTVVPTVITKQRDTWDIGAYVY